MEARDFAFGTALSCLKEGEKVARRGWNGEGMWVAYSPGFKLDSDRVFSEPIKQMIIAVGLPGAFKPYLMLHTADGEYVPWVASQTDILAEDWYLVV